ncbi:MAG: PEP-CTERM sorting domain-containing protein [Planctomycetota bacterium]
MSAVCTASGFLFAATTAAPALAGGGDESPHVVIAVNAGKIVTAFEGSDGTIIVTEDEGRGGLTNDQFEEAPFDIGFEIPDQEEINDLIDDGELPAGSTEWDLANDAITLVGFDVPGDFRVDNGAVVIDEDGESFQLFAPGSLPDAHLFFTFEGPVPGLTGSTTGQFRLSSSGFTTSDPFSITLAVPEPTSLVLFGLAAPALMLRRRRG